MDGHLWNVTETAQYLAVPVSAVYKMTSRGATTPIPHIKLGGRLRFVPSAVEEFVALWSVAGLERQTRAVSRGKRVGRLGRKR